MWLELCDRRAGWTRAWAARRLSQTRTRDNIVTIIVIVSIKRTNGLLDDAKSIADPLNPLSHTSRDYIELAIAVTGNFMKTVHDNSLGLGWLWTLGPDSKSKPGFWSVRLGFQVWVWALESRPWRWSLSLDSEVWVWALESGSGLWSLGLAFESRLEFQIPDLGFGPYTWALNARSGL